MTVYQWLMVGIALGSFVVALLSLIFFLTKKK